MGDRLEVGQNYEENASILRFTLILIEVANHGEEKPLSLKLKVLSLMRFVLEWFAYFGHIEYSVLAYCHFIILFYFSIFFFSIKAYVLMYFGIRILYRQRFFI